MAIQSSLYTTDGTTRTYPSTKHIATKSHCNVLAKKVIDSLWEAINISDYSLVNNSIVFVEALSTSIYSDIEIRVADTQNELTTSPSDVATVSSNISSINTIASDIVNVDNVALSIGAINTVSGNTTNINTIASNITNINSVATIVTPNIDEILLADTNAAIATTKASEALSSASSALASLNEFKGIYLGTYTSHPIIADVGDLYFNSALGVLYFKGTSSWVPSITPTSSTRTETLIVITSLAQVLSTTYTVGLVEVYLNGVRLSNGNDYIATTGTSISLAVGTTYKWDVDDTVLIVSYAIDTRNIYTTTEVDAFLSLKEDKTIVATKAPIASPTFTGTVSGITKSMVGLGNVDNTSDLNKPISTATQTSLNLKQNNIQVLEIQYTEADGVSAASTIAGVNQVPLNGLLKNTITGASVVGSIITLPIGTYTVSGYCNTSSCGSSQLALYDGILTTVLVGNVVIDQTYATKYIAIIDGIVVITAQKDISLKLRCSATGSMGTASTLTGYDEKYASLTIIKIG